MSASDQKSNSSSKFRGEGIAFETEGGKTQLDPQANADKEEKFARFLLKFTTDLKSRGSTKELRLCQDFEMYTGCPCKVCHLSDQVGSTIVAIRPY